MSLMAICILLGVLLCTAMLCIILLSGLLTKEMEDRAADKQRYCDERRELWRRIAVTRPVDFHRAARYFYDQDADSLPAGEAGGENV